MRLFIKFLISRIFFLHVFIALIITFVLVWGTIQLLDIYTNHGETITVPSFSGLKPEELDSYSKQYNLNYRIIDTVYNEQYERGTIIDQHPKTESKVKEQRIIYLTINSIKPAMVQMPKLIDMSLRQALARLQSYGLKPGKMEYIPHFAQNAVLKQFYNNKEIKPGTKIPKGSNIDLTLGEGLSKQKVFVPYIVGMTLDSAISTLNRKSLNIGYQEYDTATVHTNIDSISARVYKQSPTAAKNKKLFMGEYIDVWLTNDSTMIKIDSSLYYINIPQTDSLKKDTTTAIIVN